MVYLLWFWRGAQWAEARLTSGVAVISKQVGRADGGAARHALQPRLRLVLQRTEVRHVQAAEWNRSEEPGQTQPGRLTSALLSRPKNMSEEMALALANLSLASLDSDMAEDASAFLLLGSLVKNIDQNRNRLRQTDCMTEQGYLSPIGWMLEMVTSSLGSSFSRAQDDVKEALPPSASQRDPKLSPTEKGLSLYLRERAGVKPSGVGGRLLKGEVFWRTSGVQK